MGRRQWLLTEKEYSNLDGQNEEVRYITMPEAEAEANLNETLDRIVSLVTRRRRWILLTACATALATAGVLWQLPNRYTSEATLLVVQPQVPERYVTPTTTTDTGKALQTMMQEVLSRARLLGIIDELGLYPKEKNRLAPEELIERMRNDVRTTPLESNPERRDVNSFRISFIADSPHLAQKVTGRLTSLLIETNVKTRANQTTTTNNFLQEQLGAAKNKLTEQEQRLRDFKTQYLGQLPEQQQGNLQILSGLQIQLQNVMSSLSRAQQQRLYLESLTSEYQRLRPRHAPVPAISSVSPTLSPIESAQRDLDRLQSEKAAMSATFNPRHPDVLKIGRAIAEKEALLESLKVSKPPGTGKPQVPAATLDGTEYDTTIAQLKSQLEANRLETENLSKDERQLKASIAQYQNRLNLTPIREQQLAGILREHDLLKQNYADLLNKGLQSQLATSLEKQQQGQQFRVVDPPNLPTLPSSPKRVKISLGGAVAGVFLGFALALLADARDRSFHTENDVSRRFEVPLIIGVPSLFTPAEERVRNWKKELEWLGGSVLVLAVFVAEFYANRHG
jgi:polysaccharide chain length determinant protein (PEP-CTERM system associated)